MEGEIRFGRHRFDPRSGRLWAGRREVKLTPRAAAVLAALIERAGHLVTRSDLFRAVWGDTIVGDAALTACIQELRGALDDDARRPRFVETRHRRGYRFVASISSPATASSAGHLLPPTEMGSATPVMGRRRELDELVACLARAANGERQLVFVTGEPGIGKTTVVEGFLAAVAVGDGLRIARGQCIETRGVGEPYLPLLEAMTRLCCQPGGLPIARLVRHHAPTWLTQMPSVLDPSERMRLHHQTAGTTKERMLRELAEAVEVIAHGDVLILWLEDLHWSDPSTVDWLGYMARRPGPAHVLVIGSYRPGEVLTQGHPIEALKDELKVHGRCREISLPPLDASAVGEYLAHRLPGHEGLTELAGLIHQRTEGNPLFVVNVADDLLRRGNLVHRAGRWTMRNGSGPVAIAIPDDVRRMIGQELDRVSPEERRLLAAASVSGVEFSTAAVAAAEQLDLDDVERGCAALSRRASFLSAHGVANWPDGTFSGRYAFRHALYQEIVYGRLAPARRVELHRRIGEWLEAALHGGAAEAATELAMHFEQGQHPEKAVRYLQLAGETATRRSAAQEAIEQLTRALDVLRAQPDTPARAEQEVALQIALGGPLMAVKGRGSPEVERAYLRAQALCQRMGDTRQLFPVLWGLFLFRKNRGEIDAAHGFGTRLLALAQDAGDAGLLIEAHHALWSTLFARGELSGALDHATDAVALYDSDRHASLAAIFGNHDPAVCALGHGAWALELSGKPEESSRQSAEAVALARTLGHPFSEAHALLYAARLDQFRGDWRRAQTRAGAAASLAREQGFVQLQAWAAITEGWALAQGGEIAEGLASARAGLAAIRALGSEDFKTYFLGLLADTLAKNGQVETALEVLAEALVAVERTGERFYAAELHRRKGELLLEAGRERAGAARCFETALRIARQQGAWALERRVLVSRGDLGEERGLTGTRP
jgi:predicted ATPase/DNA-binding winged helix-turn-helix (wHTH) protein